MTKKNNKLVFGRSPEEHILKKTSEDISDLMNKVSYLSAYAHTLMEYHKNFHIKKKLSIDENLALNREITAMLNEVQRLSSVAQIKNNTIETKMIRNYEPEPSY